MPQTVAILTGDLIGSTQASPDVVQATMDVLADCAKAADSGARFTRFRGDGWQLYLREPGDCLRTCLHIIARLRAQNLLATRIAVGVDTIDRLPPNSLAAAMGPAFTTSGRALEAMEKHDRLAIAGLGVDAFQRQCFAFAADYTARWSKEQAEAMAYALAPKMMRQDEIASVLGITRQAVSARQKAAGARLLTDACGAFIGEYAKRFGDSA